MARSHVKATPVPLQGTSIILGGAAAQPCGITLHGFLITETGGSTNLTIDLWTAKGNPHGKPALPGTSGIHVGQIIVTKGTQLPMVLDHMGVNFADGLYIVTAGGTAVGSFFYS